MCLSVLSESSSVPLCISYIVTSKATEVRKSVRVKLQEKFCFLFLYSIQLYKHMLISFVII